LVGVVDAAIFIGARLRERRGKREKGRVWKWSEREKENLRGTMRRAVERERDAQPGRGRMTRETSISA
jgi:hypothetical protein